MSFPCEMISVNFGKIFVCLNGYKRTNMKGALLMPISGAHMTRKKSIILRRSMANCMHLNLNGMNQKEKRPNNLWKLILGVNTRLFQNIISPNLFSSESFQLV